MSVNTFDLSPSASSLPLSQGEELLTSPYTADLELRVPATISGPKRTETAHGRIWVTDQRVIFVADSTTDSSANSSSGGRYDAPPALSSLVIPYPTLLSATFHLPLFTPNHLLLHFHPGPHLPLVQTNLPDPGRGGKIEAKVVVGEGAGHAVWKRIEGERGRWAERRREEEILPTYSAGSKDGETRLL